MNSKTTIKKQRNADGLSALKKRKAIPHSSPSKGYVAKYPTKKEFLALLPAIREAAMGCGYAVGLHGSLKRDFDLIAVPWTENAAHSDFVAEAIMEAAGCIRWRVFRGEGDTKPHGRIVYCFDWHKENYKNRGYIDLSVMPRAEAT